MKKVVSLGFLGTLVCLILNGCASTFPFAKITETVSGFDNSTETVLSPAFVYKSLDKSGGSISLGLFRSSRMDKSKVILRAIVRDAQNFAFGKNLFIKIDGKVYEMESIDKLTNIETKGSGAHKWNESSLRYEVDKEFIKRMIEGESVWIKIYFSQGYVEGAFSREGFLSARSAFREYYEKVWGEKR